jgi:hypothetical protein
VRGASALSSATGRRADDGELHLVAGDVTAGLEQGVIMSGWPRW